MRTGLILAAGFGSRLAGASDVTRLKPLTPVAGRPLLLRTLDSLALAGCNRVVTVLGHGRNDVEQAVRAQYTGPLELDFVFNARYDLQNGVSVLAAREAIDGAFVLTMADHVFGDEVMAVARHHTPPTNGATLLVDYKLDTIFDMDDATKVWAEDDRIVHIGKQLTAYNCVDTGLFVCTHGLMDALDTVYREKGDASLSDGIQHLARHNRMTVLDIGDGFWQDVDTPAMLNHATQMLSHAVV